MRPLAGTSVIDAAQEAARQFPDRPAVVGADESLTYRELMRRTSAIAAILRGGGAGQHAPVAVIMARGAGQLAAVWGVLRSGAPYLCLDADQPQPRIEAILRSSGAALLVTDQPAGGAARAFDGTVYPAAGLAAAAAPGAHVPPEPGDLAYILYTSGSSGPPKGVAVTSAGIANYTAHMIGLLCRDAPVTSFASVTSLSTDLGNSAIFPALASGGCVHLVPADIARDAVDFACYMRAHEIGVLKITPSHMAALLDDPDPAVLPARALILGGEILPWDLADTVSKLSACRVFNHYGPTEATVGSLIFEVGRDAGRYRDLPSVPIGRPISNTVATVVSDTLEPVPDGAPGELLLGGQGLAREYWRDPDQTSERFISGYPGGRMFRTGDRVRRHGGGVYEFIDRLDRQVKVRGHRVELGEVEFALRQFPRIKSAVVVPEADRWGTVRLIAYVVMAGARDEIPADTAVIRRWLAGQLPAHCCPAEIVVLDEIPYTASGKLDRVALTGLRST